MACPLRIEPASGLYYVTTRDDRCEDTLHEAVNRQAWLKLFAQAGKRYNRVCHAWCLMDSHFDSIIETIGGNLAQGMRQLNGVYTPTFIRTPKCIGRA